MGWRISFTIKIVVAMMNKLFLILLLFCSGASAEVTQAFREINLDSRSQVQLPEPGLKGSDWQWLRQKRMLIYGTAAPNYPPYDITTGLQDYGGINADYLGIIGYNLNIQVRVRYYESYQLLMQALATGEVDLIANASDEDKQKYGLLLTHPYINASPALVERTDSLLHGTPIRRVGIESLYRNHKALIGRFPDGSTQVYDSSRRALEALSFNNLDAFIGDAISARYLINQANLNNLRLQLLPQEDASGFSFGVDKSNSRLQRILNRVLEALPDSAVVAIQSRWSGGAPMASEGKHLLFTSLERKWIEDNPRVRVVVNDDFAPLNFFDEQGYFHGLTADVLEAIAARTGLRFDVIRASSLQQSLEEVKSGKADVVAGVTLDAVWPNGLLTTRSYLFNSWVLVGHEAQKADLQPQRIALVRGHPLDTFLRQHYPQSRIIPVATPYAGIEALTDGRADVLVLPMISADFLLSHGSQPGLQILRGLDSEPARFVMGISGSEYPLATILDKALLNIPPEDIHAMTRNWYNNAYLMNGESAEGVLLPQYYGPLLLALVILLLFVPVILVFYHRRHRQRLVALRNEMAVHQQKLLDAVPLPIYLTDLKEKITSANVRFYQALGLVPPAAVGDSLESFQLSLSGAEDIALNLNEQDPHALLITRHLAFGEQPHILQQWSTLLMAEEGHCVSKVGGWFDVTEREQLIVQLQQAKELADRANRAKTTFLATMSHEIRTPLNAIIGMLELVLRQQQRGGETNIELLNIAHSSAHSLLALIGDILDISRIESERLVLHPERADLRQLIESVAILFDGVARQKGLGFKLDIDAEIAGDILIDPVRFKQVISNLVSNAIKFTERGTVTLSALVDAISDERLEMRIRVIDTGKGIEKTTQSKLFQPFSQEQNMAGSNGAGLGLYICRTLVTMMRGTITLVSEQEIGTEVTVSLSIPRLMAVVPRPMAASAPAFERPGLRILVVEDHRAGRLLLTQQLRFLGHHPIPVEDGVQALKALEGQPVDLVITDCHMPNMDGYDFTRRLRLNERERGLSAVSIWGLTADAQGSAREACLQAGMDDCLFKPVNLQILTEKLRPLLATPGHTGKEPWVFDPATLPAELRVAGVFAEFAETLIESLKEDGELLNAQREHLSADNGQIAEVAHKLLGAARLVNADRLAEACRWLMTNTTDENMAAVQQAVDELVTALQQSLSSTAAWTTNE